MQPWKMFIRSVSVVTLITAGGFAAGQAVVPFANASRGVSPAVEEEAPETEAPEVDPAAEVDETTTTTTAPAAEAPSTDPVVVPEPTKPPAEEAPESSTPTTTAVPVEITVVDPAPAAPAAPKAKKAKKEKEKAKGDHNCDGKLDNGWYKKRNDPPANHTYPEPRKGTTCVSPPASAPASAPAPAPASAPGPASPDKGRSATAPGQTKSDRSGPASGQDNNRPASAPSQMKKAV